MISFRSAWDQLDDARRRSQMYREWRVSYSAGLTTGTGVREQALRGGARFDAMERALLALGEESGTLEQSLRLLADHFARKHSMMLAVRKRMTYPLFIGICATCIAPFPLLYFGHAGAYLLTVSVGLAGWVVAGGTVVTMAANAYGRSPAMVRARLARSLATAIEAGLPLGRSIRLAADASGDDDVVKYFRAIPERQLTSESVVSTFAGCPHITPDFLGLLTVAEKTGDYATSMKRLAELYDDGFR